MTKSESQFSQYRKAVERLREVLKLPKNDIVRDSAIQRFEFSLDLAWKLVKSVLEEEHGLVCRSPKECFREAYKQGLVEYSEEWLELVGMRNETVHTYSEAVAEEIYQKLPGALKKFEDLFDSVDRLTRKVE